MKCPHSNQCEWLKWKTQGGIRQPTTIALKNIALQEPVYQYLVVYKRDTWSVHYNELLQHWRGSTFLLDFQMKSISFLGMKLTQFLCGQHTKRKHGWHSLGDFWLRVFLSFHRERRRPREKFIRQNTHTPPVHTLKKINCFFFRHYKHSYCTFKIHFVVHVWEIQNLDNLRGFFLMSREFEF